MDFGDCANVVRLCTGCVGGKDESKFKPEKLHRWLHRILGWTRLGKEQFVVEEASGEDQEDNF